MFPEPFAKAVADLEMGAMVVVRGKVEREEETVRMLASEVMSFDAMRARMVRQLSIRLTAPPHGRATFEALADLFTNHRGDRRVALELELRGHSRPLRVRAELAQVRVRPSERLIAEVERICGAGTAVLW